MPTRLIRQGILDSERVNRLSIEAELFYRRLLSVVDDYGRFDARPTMLRVNCFPLRVDHVDNNQLVDWLSECTAQGLILLYAQNGSPQTQVVHVAELWETIADSSKRPYLEVQDFRQKTRAKSSKFPDPPAVDSSMCPADAGHPQHTSQTCERQTQNICQADEMQMRSEAEAKSETGVLAGGLEAEGKGELQSAGPPVDKSKSGRRPHFEGIAKPRPDKLDAAYDKVKVPEITEEDDIWAIRDPIILAMAVTADRETQSWLGWVRMAHKLRKRLGREQADRRWWSVCSQFWHEVRAGEVPDNPGSTLTASIKKGSPFLDERNRA